MKRVSLLKRIGLYRQYKKTIRECSSELESTFTLRIDDANRLYTVLNIPDDIIGEAYSLKKSDIDRISESYIRQYSSELRKYLNSKGLEELYDYYEVNKVDKYSYLLIIGFSLFRSDERRERLYKRWLPIGVISAVVTSIILWLSI
jgi:hypothetical protein